MHIMFIQFRPTVIMIMTTIMVKTLIFRRKKQHVDIIEIFL